MKLWCTISDVIKGNNQYRVSEEKYNMIISRTIRQNFPIEQTDQK